METNENGLEFSICQIVWAIQKKDGKWVAREGLIVGIVIDKRECYVVQCEQGKFSHAEGELFATKQEAEYAVDILRNNTGGVQIGKDIEELL